MGNRVYTEITRRATGIKAELMAFAVIVMVQSSALVVMLISSGNGFSGVDCGVQYMPFFCELYHKLTQGGSIFYSWSGASGYDFWATYAYYLSSPLNFLVVLFKEDTIIYFVNILIILKTSLCGASFTYYIKTKYPGGRWYEDSLFGVIYGMSGFMLAYGLDVMWLDSIFLFPFILLQMEKLVYEKKKWCYILLLSLAIFFNFYSGFIICAGVFFYYFTFKFTGIKDFLGKSLRILLCSALSAGISLIFLYPSMSVYKELGSFTSESQWGILGSFFDTLRSFLFLEEPVSMTPDDGYANLYITVFAVVLFAVFFFSSRFTKAEKIRTAIITLFLIVSMNIGVLNYIWHGFRFQSNIPNRFSYMLIFLMLVTARRVFGERERISVGEKGIGSVAAAVFLLITAAGSGVIYKGVISAVLIGVYAIILISKKKPVLRTAAICVLPVVGVTVMLGLHLNGLDLNNVTALTDYAEENMEAVESMDDGFSRVRLSTEVGYDTEKESTDDFLSFLRDVAAQNAQYNESLVYGVNSLSLFSSYLNVNYSHFLDSTGCFGGQNFISYSADNPLMDMLLGVKYVLNRSVKSSAQVYDTLINYENTELLENKYALSVGYVVPQTFADEEVSMSELDVFMNLNSLAVAAGGGGIYETLGFNATKPENCTIQSYSQGVIELVDVTVQSRAALNCTLKSDGEIYLFTYQVTNANTDIYVNGEKARLAVTNKNMIFLGSLKKGDVITAYITPVEENGALSVGIYGAALNEEKLYSLYLSLADEQLNVDYYDDNTIHGSINVKNDGSSLFLSVPVGKGWNVRVDNEKAETDSIFDSFMLLTLDSGEHEIELDYETPGFREGALMTTVCLFVFLAVCLWESGIIVKPKNHRR